MKFGINNNISDYVGVFADGNPILAAGLGGLIPVQVGLSASSANTPSLNITLDDKHGLYNKFGVQRASARAASPTTRDTTTSASPSRRRTRTRCSSTRSASCARPLPRSPDVAARRADRQPDAQSALRRRTAKNWAVYALGDLQVRKIDPTNPFRGLFVGAPALFASPDFNIYTRSFELRGYDVGVFDARPADTITLTASYNGFNDRARRATIGTGVDAQSD